MELCIGIVVNLFPSKSVVGRLYRASHVGTTWYTPIIAWAKCHGSVIKHHGRHCRETPLDKIYKGAMSGSPVMAAHGDALKPRQCIHLACHAGAVRGVMAAP